MNNDQIIAIAAIASVTIAFVGVLVSIVGVFISLFLSLHESKRFRFQSGIDTLLKLVDDFDSDMKWKIRREAAKEIEVMRKTEGEKPDAVRNIYLNHTNNISDILDFFDMVAFLLKQGAIDRIFVWHEFFYWIDFYYRLCRDYIKFEQEKPKESRRWEDLVWLHPHLIKVELNRGHRSKEDLEPDQGDIERFIDEEKRRLPRVS